MTNNRILLSIVIAFFTITTYCQSDNDFTTKWSNGHKIESTNKQFKMKFGGRIMYDVAFFSQQDTMEALFGKLQSGSEFRRARFFSSGQIYDNVKYKINFDFAGGSVVFKDVYIQISKLPYVGNLRVGNFKEPFRLEVMTSSKYMVFMERSTMVDFIPERNSGGLFYNSYFDNRLGWQLGLFRRSNKFGDDKDAGLGYNLTGRITGLPLIDKEKKQLLHLGLSYSFRKPDNEKFAIKSRPESHLSHRYINTGSIQDVRQIGVIGTELSFVSGPICVQGEFSNASTTADIDTNSNYSFTAFYGQISYFLTGESRKYKNSYEGYNRTKPNKNFGEEGGCGAWEIALRYSSSNLNSGNIKGGQLQDITAGVNWYLNPATRIMFNYVYAELLEIGNTSIAQIRFQIDF